jgi:hypothetical protein
MAGDRASARRVTALFLVAGLTQNCLGNALGCTHLDEMTAFGQRDEREVFIKPIPRIVECSWQGVYQSLGKPWISTIKVPRPAVT